MFLIAVRAHRICKAYQSVARLWANAQCRRPREYALKEIAYVGSLLSAYISENVHLLRAAVEVKCKPFASNI